MFMLMSSNLNDAFQLVDVLLLSYSQFPFIILYTSPRHREFLHLFCGRSPKSSQQHLHIIGSSHVEVQVLRLLYLAATTRNIYNYCIRRWSVKSKGFTLGFEFYNQLLVFFRRNLAFTFPSKFSAHACYCRLLKGSVDV